jgi:hypothetical protein
MRSRLSPEEKKQGRERAHAQGMYFCNICERTMDREKFSKDSKNKANHGVRTRCKECIAERDCEYQKENVYRRRQQFKRWSEKNKEYRRQYFHERNKIPDVILRKAMRTNLKRYMAIAMGESKIKESWDYDEIGCSPEFLKEYIEALFDESMGWENHGLWHIDHIMPLAKGGTNHYSNLQPLWAEANLQKNAKWDHQGAGAMMGFLDSKRSFGGRNMTRVSRKIR